MAILNWWRHSEERPGRSGGLPALTTMLIATGSVLAGCGGPGTGGGSGSPSTPSTGPAASGPAVVAASTWEGAFAKAAGATNITVIVPQSIKHAPDYDPKPSDLAAVAHADYLLYAPFEGFVGQLKQAAGAKARQIQLNLDNSPDNVKTQVRLLAGMFGTQDRAEQWITTFDHRYTELAQQLRAAWPGDRPPTAVVQTFLGFAAQMSGTQVLATYGPDPVTPAQLAALAAKKPAYVFDNEQMSTGEVLPGSGAKQLTLTNYPGPDLDLLAVYQDTANTLINAWHT